MAFSAFSSCESRQEIRNFRQVFILFLFLTLYIIYIVYMTIRSAKLTLLPEFGRAFLPPPDSPLRTSDLLPPNTQGMAGSVMMFRFPSLEDTWNRIKEDVYWTGGVWDKDKVVVEEFCVAPGESVPY